MWHSCTGFIIYINGAPISWFLKKQATIESSFFGSEFVALKQGVETLWGLHYKLWMMGVEISAPSYIYGDNISVIHTIQWLESTLKLKSNSVCYHVVHELVAMDESLTAHIHSENILWSTLAHSRGQMDRHTSSHALQTQTPHPPQTMNGGRQHLQLCSQWKGQLPLTQLSWWCLRFQWQ